MIDVDVFIPCFIDQLYPETAWNMIKVLEKLGCKIHYSPRQTCCGQPAYNAGFKNEAIKVARKFLNDFTGKRYIVVPSGSCVGMIRKSYEEMFDNSSQRRHYKLIQSKTYEFTDFLVNILKVEDVGATFNAKVTYHDSCSALRELGIKKEPRILLSHVNGLELVEMEESETCCGFGGTFSVKMEPISSAMADQKLINALATEAEYLIGTDVSCIMMHLEGYARKHKMPIKTLHIADVLAQGY